MCDTCWLESLGTCNFITGFFDQRSAANMMKESAKMQGFEHPHVLNITGVCVDAGPAPYIIMPFMANGSLLAYIKKEKRNLVIPNDAADDELASLYYQIYMYIYRSLTEECHLTSQSGGGCFFKYFHNNQKRAPMYAHSNSLSLNLLKYWTNSNVTGIGSSSSDGMQHSKLQHATVSMVWLASTAPLAG